MDLERLSRILLMALVVLTAGLLAYGALATGAVRSFDFLVLQLLAAVLAAGFALYLALNPSARLLWPPVCWGVVGFVAWGALRYAQADVEFVARKELVRICVYGLMFLLVLNLGCQRGVGKRLTWFLVGLGTLIAIYGIVQFATQHPKVWAFDKPAIYIGRASGTFINPNHFAGFLEMLVPVAIAFAVRGRLPVVARIFLGYAALVLLTGIGLSLSRGAWVATVLCLPWLLFWLIGKRWYRIPLVLLFVVLVAGSIAVLAWNSEAAARRLTKPLALDGPDSARGRLWLWQSAFRMWRDQPWLGTGPGHFDVRYPQYRPPEIQARAGYAHNDYLNTLAEWGVIGTAVILATWALLFLGIARSWKHLSRGGSIAREPSNREALTVGATMGLITLLVHAFADFNFHIPANALTAVVLMALLAGQTRFATNRYRLGGAPWVRYAFGLLFLASAVGLLSMAPRQFRETRALQRAERPGLTFDAQRRALLAAQAAEPRNADTAYQIGERWRQQGWSGTSDWQDQLSQAMEWFGRASQLNPHDPYPHLRIAMCLDWLGRHDEARLHHERALALDPHNYYILAIRGWHHVQTEDHAGALPWFERSIELHHAWKNRIARTYLAVVRRKLAENPPSAPAPSSAPGSRAAND
jgi:O-antigen ligase/Flp pilus assembly protein TadD